MLKKMYCLVFFTMSFLPSLFSSEYQLAIVSMFKNEASYLREWVEYHRMVGVDHFWLYNNESTDNWQEVLDPYIKQGIVEVTYRPYLPGAVNNGKSDGWWDPTMLNAYNDGLAKSKGKADWVAFMDSDEYLVPMKESTITECLNNHFSKASAIYASWLNFGTGRIRIPQQKPILMRLTYCSDKPHTENFIGKTIVRPECISCLNYIHCFPLNPGCAYFDGDGCETTFSGYQLAEKKHHEAFIRINHYPFRDERFFHEVRLPRTPQYDKGRRLEQYIVFNKKKDFRICEVIKQHAKEYEAIWKDK